MAKQKTTKRKQQSKKIQSKKSQSSLLSNQLSFLNYDSSKSIYISLGIIILAILIFFGEGIFSGKMFASADNLSPLSFKTFLDDAKAQGIYPLWTPYIFMGMPSLASLTTGIPAVHNIFSYIWDSVWNAIAGENLFMLTLPYYFLFSISLFFYARYKFKNNLIALYCALTGVFATGIIQLIIVGHHTKMMTFAFFPLIMLILDKMIDAEEDENKFKLMMNFALLAILIYIQLHFHHIQMMFYSYMMISIYILYNLIYRLIKKLEVKKIVRAFILFIVATIFAVAMDADIIMSINDYKQFSMRGQASIEKLTDPSSTDKNPLSYDYATNWSFSPGEVMTFILPYYYGFGNVEVDEQRVNLYWGQMPFTDSPVYFGVITLLLAIIGIIYNFRKNIFVQSLTVIIIFFLLLSFGRTFPLIFDLFFNHFPFFSSFRAPVMIHYYIDLAFVILAGFGLVSIVDSVKDGFSQTKFRKLSYVLFSIAGLMFLISLVGFEGSYKDAVASGPLAQKLQQQGATSQQITQYTKQVASLAYENIISDLRLHSVMLILVIGLAYFYSQKRLALNLFLAGTIIIGVFDILNVSGKTLHWDEKSHKDSFFAETDVTRWILNKEPDTFQYRIAELNKGRLIYSNSLAYYRLHMFNGYHGAKIRIYQDAVDVAGGENPFLLGLGNVKYIISDEAINDSIMVKEVYKGSNIIYENKLFLPRAFFAGEYKVESGINILKNIKEANFDPRKIVFVETDINKKIDKPDSSASVKLSKADIHNIEYDVNASGNNLLVFSEIYYPAGWKAYIDGNETEIYKTDYLLRSIVVPPGQHKVEFKFHPASYYTGKSTSIAANIIIVLVLLIGIGGFYFKKKKIREEPSDESS
ncbi:MAG: YfhO family protein [Ignavibacteria bacterium]|nr:YfhO family protein [Ignavibacteria bacterium]